MDTERLDRFRTALEDELTSIDRQLVDHGVSPHDLGAVEVGVAEGFADSAQATAERSEILGIIDKLMTSRRAVTDALARFDSGTFGLCERCGQEIAAERLEALPSTRLCVSCAQSARP
jgi:DnaK suppressor protein